MLSGVIPGWVDLDRDLESSKKSVDAGQSRLHGMNPWGVFELEAIARELEHLWIR